MDRKTNDPRVQKFLTTAEIIAKYRKDREVVFYGNSEALRGVLREYYGINSLLVASTHLKERSGDNIPLGSLKGMSDKYYIAAPFLQPKKKYKNLLNSLGYNEFSDFVFAIHDKIDSSNGFSNYSDEYGNKIDVPDGIGIIIEPSVGNSNIHIAKSAKLLPPAKIRICGSFAEISIEAKCRFSTNTRIVAADNSRIIIGEQSSFERGLFVHACTGAEVSIGADCMFSSNVSIYCGDGHAVFDVETGERTLDIINENPKNSTILGDHVWVGLNAMILGGTNIGRSSIIGAGAVVKGKFPNNCAIAGNPAKIVRKNVTWSRNNFETDMQNCGEENIAMTE